jgi:hypothetical protein
MDCRNPDHASAGTTCAGCARGAERELTQLRDQQARGITEDRDLHKRVKSAARREAHGHMVTWAQLYFLGPAMKKLTWPLEELLGGMSVLDPAIGRTKEARARLERLQVRAKQAQEKYWEVVGQAEPTWRADPREAEILRLRQVIETHARPLHVQAPPSDGFTACRCPGCELIRDMDGQPADLAAGDPQS